MKKAFNLLIVAISLFDTLSSQIPTSKRAQLAINKNESSLKKDFKNKKLIWGSDIFIRVFKYTKELEVWVKKGNTFSLFKTYPICTFSGGLGPKKKEGDRKSPEGFYYTKPYQLNPNSQLYLSFNIGYPNTYDKQKGYTGSAIMIHGYCVSIGCFAMTNPQMEEIYTIVNGAYKHKQALIRIHIFPFRMSQDKMEIAKEKAPSLYPFWKNLKEGYDYFEKFKTPPNVEVKNKRYIFNTL